jgi:hypothetical protein
MQEFSPQHLQWFEDQLESFPGPVKKRSRTKAMLPCPAHDDSTPSLSVDLTQNGKGPKVTLHCFAGCNVQDILEETTPRLTFDDLYWVKNGAATKAATGNTTGNKEDVGLPGCSLAAYSAYKRLPVEFLRDDPEISLEEILYPKFPGKDRGQKIRAVYVPYPDEWGEVMYKRFRVALTGDMKVLGKSGASPVPYGLHRLGEGRESGYVYLAEGESDCHTLWFHKLPALGIPGASSWRDAWAKYLEDIPEIRVLVEPDEGGRKLWSSLERCEALRGRLVKMVL